METGPPLIEIHYLPGIAWFSAISAYNAVFLEQQEHFVKQTYRNRCSIYGANGKLDLSIPVKSKKQRKRMCETAISNEADWQRLHWRSIRSAYRSSPYFEYYEDSFAPFFETEQNSLIEFDLELIRLLMRLLDLKTEVSLTTEYKETYDETVIDLRERIHPKKELPIQDFPEYQQVFSAKLGFIPNLSVIDLLFNQGPRSKNFIPGLKLTP